jgi:hypothetical protein
LSSLHIQPALTTSPITSDHTSLIIPIQQTLTSVPVMHASNARDGPVLVPGMNPRKLINAGHVRSNTRNRPEKTSSNKLKLCMRSNCPEKIMSNKLKLCMMKYQVLKITLLTLTKTNISYMHRLPCQFSTLQPLQVQGLPPDTLSAK